MGKGYIVRRGGGGEQTTKPIFNSVVSAVFTSITVNIENDDNSEAVLYYSVVNADPGPDQVDTFEITLDGRTADDATITGLTANSSYVLYIKAFALGKFPSDIVTVINQLQTASPIAATGGTITNYSDTGVDYRVHTFTGNGTFAVSNASVAPFNQVDYLIIAGGGGGGGWGGGGGAGGYRTTNGTSGGPSPTTESKVTITAQNYGVTVGGGGNAGTSTYTRGGNGAISSVFNITSTGGGGGGAWPDQVGLTGGSGGGATALGTFGAGTANQGFAGGAGPNNNSSSPYRGMGGGGGAGQAGQAGNQGSGGRLGGNGGNGLANLLRTGSNETRGGGGGGHSPEASTVSQGGLGGGGNGGRYTPELAAQPGVANTGGGGGSAWGSGSSTIRPGGSGIVIIRYVVGGNV